MSLAAKLRRAPGRIVTGAFILNSGLSKLTADDDMAKGLHGMASNAYPPLEKLQPTMFTKALGVGETVLGGALLTPFVRSRWAGLGLMAFSGGLLGLYWRTPGVHQEGNPRPTAQGIPLAKDIWMFGVGTSLVLDDVVADTGATREVHRAQRRARRAERKLNRAERRAEIEEMGSRFERLASAGMQHAREAVSSAAEVARERAEEASQKAATATAHAAGVAGSKLSEAATGAAHNATRFAKEHIPA